MATFRQTFKTLSIFHKSMLKIQPNHRINIKYSSVTGYAGVDKTLNVVTGGRIDGWLAKYEDAVGLKEVREAQSKVMQAEAEFIELQGSRREKQMAVTDIQSKLKQISVELDKVQRGDAKYLQLLTEEHKIIQQEGAVERELRNLEQTEREKFSALSAAVRDSHEKERARTERTKYWSIIGSAIGAFIGILGTSVNNYLRMRELRGIVKESAEEGVELKGIVSSLSETTANQHNQIKTFIHDLKGLVNPGAKVETGNKSILSTVLPSASDQQMEAQTKEILELIKSQDKNNEKDMNEIKKIVASWTHVNSDGQIVCVGPQVENMLQETEKNLEWRMKINALWTVTFIYGAFALSIPVLYSIFKGN